MPMYFGHKAHLRHGVPMRPQRSGPQMQSDLDLRRARASLTWEDLERLAWRDAALRADVEKARSSGLRPGEALDRLAGRFEAASAARESSEARRAAALAAAGRQEK